MHTSTHSTNDPESDSAQVAAVTRSAIAMYCLSILFLALLAALVVSMVDIPRVAELAALDAENTGAAATSTETIELSATVFNEASALAHKSKNFGKWLLIALLCLWPLFWLEIALRAKDGEFAPVTAKTMLHLALVCLLPALRLGLPSKQVNKQVWIPGLSWQTPGRKLYLKLERSFGKPMLIIALLILPILLVEFLLKGVIDTYYWLRIVLHISTGFIWFAFAFEFITMISASDRKLKYIKSHWLDLAIIVFPFISFLRGIRVLRLAKLAQLQKVAKVGRVYRMRGLGMKAFKAMLMLHIVQRIFRITPEKSLKKLRNEYDDKAYELEILKEEIAELEQSIASIE